MRADARDAGDDDASATSSKGAGGELELDGAGGALEDLRTKLHEAEGAARDASGPQGLVPGADAAGGARRRRRERAAPAADGVRVERVVREGGGGALDAGPRRSMCWSTRRWQVDVFPEALRSRPRHRPV